ncbi:MAG: Gfo/Idh/MocA family protein [Halobacteriaceae archaeon]
MSSDPLRVAVVGCGGMGRTHANNVRGAGHGVVAGVDVNEGARDDFAEEFGAETFADTAAMLEDVGPDAVVVTTPNAFHEEAAVAALQRNVAVLCEKPLADSLDAAERIADAARRSDAFCMVGFHNRFSAAADLAVAYREDGRFGDVSHVEGEYVRRRGVPGVGSWFTDADLAGGGAVVDVGVHLVDFALYLAGFPEVTEVSATTRSEFGGREDYVDPEGWSGHGSGGTGAFEVEDSASAFLRCADGTTMSLEVAWACNRTPSKDVVLRGTDAGAECEVGGDEITVRGVDGAGVDHYVDSELTGHRDVSGHDAEDRAFLDAVAAGEAPETNTVEEGLAVQRVLDAIYRSNEQGAAVSL